MSTAPHHRKPSRRAVPPYAPAADAHAKAFAEVYHRERNAGTWPRIAYSRAAVAATEAVKIADEHGRTLRLAIRDQAEAALG